jgi:hypothetical protein
LFRQTTLRVFLPAVAMFTAYVASGCAVALGPGYTIEKQQIEVTYTVGAPDRVSIRAWYQLKNTGTRPLEAIDLQLPAGEIYAPNEMGIEWRGKTLPPAPAADADGHSHVPLGASWEVSGGGELAVTYNLKISSDEAGAESPGGRAFFLPNTGWYPVLLPPIGAFTSGGTPPAKWELAVTVPEGYRVHASGDEVSRDRSKRKNGPNAGEIFEQKPGNSFNPFVAAGPYVEQEVRSAAGPVLLWSTQPVSLKRANEIANRVGTDVSYFRTEFGAQGGGKQSTWIIGCNSGGHGRQMESKLSRTDCLTAPYSAVVSPDFFGDEAPKESVEDIDIQLAATWLQFPAQAGRYSTKFPLSAIGDYAVFALNASENPSSRDVAVRELLQRVSASPNAEKPLITVSEKDADEVIERARLQSELFFIALEDRCGAQNLHRGIARAMRILRGQTWDLSDLRSAVEAECGGPVLESFFREWMHGNGVPADFRAHYLGAAVGKTDE